ncbi:MAG: hypothetical protein HY537_13480 [Deltaproteobacteria bacterium]|nr:hypothetical protein [Deltaproteobacteria bacterium]
MMKFIVLSLFVSLPFLNAAALENDSSWSRQVFAKGYGANRPVAELDSQQRARESDLSSNDLGGFYNYYCGKFTRSGQWYLSWGKQDPRFHCIVVDHQLGPTGSPIQGSSYGYYDAYDMNRMEVTCRKKSDSFVLEDFGAEVIRRAYWHANRLGATHCLFRIRPLWD